MSYQIFVCACDSYEWIFPDFIHYAKKNLPEEYAFFSEYIYNEELNIVPTYQSKWNERMRWILSNLSCRDVIYLQEDFLILSVDREVIDEAYHFHKSKNAYITKLGNNYEFCTSKYPLTIGKYQVYLQDPADVYLMSHQPVAIFNREFLLSTLTDETSNASLHEVIGSDYMRASGTTKVFCLGEPNRPKNYSDIFHIEHAIRKGEVLPDAIPLLENYK